MKVKEMCEDLYPQMNSAIDKAVKEKERFIQENEEVWILENFDTFHFLQSQELNLLERSFWTRLFLRTLAKMEFIEDFYIVAKSDLYGRAHNPRAESKVWKTIKKKETQNSGVASLLDSWRRNL